MLRGLVSERINLAGQAQVTVAAGWGGEQQVSGPMLVVPVRHAIRDTRKQTRDWIEYVYVLPDTLEIDARLETGSRRLGIYSVPVYQSRLSITARIRSPRTSRRQGANRIRRKDRSAPDAT